MNPGIDPLKNINEELNEKGKIDKILAAVKRLVRAKTVTCC